ncbi:ATP-binding protein [Flavobacterium sp. 22076]|uniref:ATP-binding protein n=1 Tax=unclassified Flavobacterium TaxID=196869 RepID=UPI003F86FB1D
MKLERIKIKNFRCYNRETIFEIDDLVCIIGKNDIGKSTIIEALDAFFNDNIDAGDLSSNGDSNIIELTCSFSGMPEQIILDTSIRTSAEEEGILNNNNELEIIRRYSVGGTISKSVFLNCYYPENPELSDLLSLKNDSLKVKAENLKIDLKGIPKKQNPPLRKVLRDHFGGNRMLKEIKVDGNLPTESNLKTIWSKLKTMLPIYTLFKVDKPLDDKDKDVQDPMKSAVEEALAIPEIQELLEQIESKVREKSSEVADRIIEKLKDIDESLAEKLKSDFKKSPSWKSVFDLTLLNENNIPLNKRGSGIRRLVLLSFFQAQAEKRKGEQSAPSIIYAIEEPETSQHPNHQLLLIKALIDLSEQQNTQVLFTSHSSNLVREIPVQALRFISLSEDVGLNIDYGIDRETRNANEETIKKVIKTLGILPNPADKVRILVYVEGNHDVNGLKRYSKILCDEDQNLINLNSEEIAWVITGGSSLKHYLENKYLEGLGKPEFHLYDSDVASYIVDVATINAEGNPLKTAFNTTKSELESYLHHEAINEAYLSQGNTSNLLEILDIDDVPFKVAENLYLNTGGDWTELSEEKKKEKANGKKGLLNKLAVENMTIERLKQRNGYDEMRGWLLEIKRLIDES